MKKWIRDNSLSIVFFTLFLFSLITQSISGFRNYSDTLRTHGRPAIKFGQYLNTGDFLDAVFVNWQAAILQLGCLIVFATVLRQKGASHSRKPDPKPDQRKHRTEKNEPWIYRNSLGLAFALLFVAAFTAHLFFGTRAFNQQRSLANQPRISVYSYCSSANCWSKILQTWQAEFIGISLFLVLSIFLRQAGSAESKPVDSRNSDTGDTNK